MRWMVLMLTARQLALTEERIVAAELARHDLVEFARLNTPHPGDRFNSRLSRYEWVAHHRLIADALERVARGEINRLEIEVPPRHGKSEIAIRQFSCWMMGRAPYKSGIVLTHTDTLATEHGRDVRDYWQGPGFQTVFGDEPGAALRSDSRASDRLQSVAGGTITFSGCGGLGAGVGGHWLLVDDLFKNSEDATSEVTRNAKWRAYNVDCKSRLNDESCPIVMIGSRRNEDDVQGRIFDPTNPHHDAKESARWTRIRLPALSEGPGDPLSRPKDAALWPQKFGREFFADMRNNASEIIREDFQTQYQCHPRPQEGTWFRKSWLKTYKASELPKQLRIYVSSDHAYRARERNDATCLLVVGIDPTGAIYVLSDTWWQQATTDKIVDAMFAIAKRRQVAQWWAARDAISGSLEPFIRRRMNEEHCYFPLNDSISESRDLVARSSSIRGMMARGEVFWPSDWPQWPEAENQLLAFPGKHDDLVAALAMLGMGMDRMVSAEGPKKNDLPERGTFAWHNFGKQEKKTSNTAGWA